MKKKISILLCVLVTALCFAGCSGKGADSISKDDKENSKIVSEYVIGMFSSMDDAGFDSVLAMSDYELDYQLLAMSYQNQQNGGPAMQVASEDFRGMIKAWRAGIDECGAYLECGDYAVEEKRGEIIVSTTAKYEERQATISISFDEDLNMESLDISAKYSIGEIMQKAGLNTLLGMGTVFVVLIFLAFIISLMKYIPAIMEKLQKKKTPAVEVTPATPVAEETVADETDDLELIAVITAAIAASEGTSTDGFVVRSIKRRPSNHWN